MNFCTQGCLAQNLGQAVEFVNAELPLAPFGLRNDNFPIGIPFDSVNVSKRILENDLPCPEDLYNSSSNNTNFNISPVKVDGVKDFIFLNLIYLNVCCSFNLF